MAAEAARREIRFVDAPVTGSAPAAAEAKLIFWVGADPDDLERIRPLLLCMGNKIVHAGGHGTGTSVKMVMNLLLGTGMAAFAEAMALGKGLGLSSKMLFDSLLGTRPRSHRFSQRNGRRSRAETTKPNFRCAGCKRICISRR